MSDSSKPSAEDYECLEDSLGYLIKQAYALLQRAVDAEMVHLDLTAMQWRPLMMLAQGKADTAADIARLAGTDTGAVTRMLDRLECKGLVRRVRSQEDRRIIKLELTREGVQAASRIPAHLDKVFQDHTIGLQAAEIAQLKDYLRRLINNGAGLQ